MRQSLLPFLTPLLLLLGSCVRSENPEAGSAVATPPNVLIFLADDLGYGDLGCYGHPTIQTPHIDQLAAEGLRFLNCYAASPVCSPSRVGLLTGRIPNRVGVYDWIPENSAMHLPRTELTIAAFLKEHGYQTGMFGKWHCNGKFNTPDQPQPGDLGFDHWFATQNNAIPSHLNPKNFVENGTSLGELQGYSSELVADRAIRWLKNRDQAKPFFCYIPFHEPHEPVESPRSLVETYEGKALNTDQAQYFASVSNMDQAVGRIMATLRQLKADQNTLVIFTSDNGPEILNRYPGADRCYGSSGNLRGMKVHLYEGGIRVPGIFRWPGKIDAGQVSDQAVASFDFLPTLAAIIGGTLPSDRPYDGENILPLLTGQQQERQKEMFWFYPTAVDGPNVAMVFKNWKLTGYTKHRYLVPGNTKGILIGNNTVQAIPKDSVENIGFSDLTTYPAESQSLASGNIAILDSLKPTFLKRFYELRDDSPVLEMGFD